MLIICRAHCGTSLTYTNHPILPPPPTLERAVHLQYLLNNDEKNMKFLALQLSSRTDIRCKSEPTYV
jgi:hypothetical protein